MAGVRDVPIEPALLPLLTVMYNRRTSDEDLLLPVLREQNEDFRADTIREHLRRPAAIAPVSSKRPTR